MKLFKNGLEVELTKEELEEQKRLEEENKKFDEEAKKMPQTLEERVVTVENSNAELATTIDSILTEVIPSIMGV